MKRASVLFAALMAACTYGPPEDHVNVQNVALKPDGTLLAVIVKYERYRRAAGLSAFPDGGVPRTLEQRADLYIIDLRLRAQLYRGELPAPPDQRLSFSPWLMGWEGDRVYFKITGCPGSPGSECYGSLVRTSVFALSAAGPIAPVTGSVSPILTSSRDGIDGYITAGVEPYGVSISTQLGSPRTPILRFVDLRLQIVLPQSAAQPNRHPSGPLAGIASLASSRSLMLAMKPILISGRNSETPNVPLLPDSPRPACDPSSSHRGFVHQV